MRPGTRRDAVLFACSVNVTHGLTRTRDDKRKTVTLLLEDDECGQLDVSALARMSAVSRKFVRLILERMQQAKAEALARDQAARQPKGEPATPRQEDTATQPGPVTEAVG